MSDRNDLIATVAVTAVAIALAVGMLILAAIVFTGVVKATDECIVEPASPWAPQGYICPPMYGEGTASTWPGPGVARNDCVWPWTDCEPITITSLDTGRSVIVTPTMWCMCWVGVTGPLGETARIVDLDPATLAALGLGGPGLYEVRVTPASAVQAAPSPSHSVPAVSPTPPMMLPDTAYNPVEEVTGP